jgi:hypothetical protein
MLRLSSLTVTLIVCLSSGFALASDWYLGAYCSHEKCMFRRKRCNNLNMSPAEIYEDEKEAGNNPSITEGPDGRVLLSIENDLFVFFPSQDACRAFVRD